MSLADAKPADPYHRVVHAIPQTTDVGFFYVRDDISRAEDAGSMPTAGFRGDSKSVKDCRLSASGKLPARSVTPVGICGGYVEGASDTNARFGHRDTILNRRSVKRGKRHNRDDVKRRTIARMLQERGYNVTA